MTLAEARDSQAWAKRVSVSRPGAVTNVRLGLRGVALMRADRLSESGGSGVIFNINGTPGEKKGAIALATKRMGGGHTQVGRPVTRTPARPKMPCAWPP